MVLQPLSSVHVIRYYLQQKPTQKQDTGRLKLVFHTFRTSLCPISLDAPPTFCCCVLRATATLSTALLLQEGLTFLSLTEQNSKSCSF